LLEENAVLRDESAVLLEQEAGRRRKNEDFGGKKAVGRTNAAECKATDAVRQTNTVVCTTKGVVRTDQTVVARAKR
jgi:hypothetical protein